MLHSLSLGGAYSVMIRSAHSPSDTKIFGLPNLAPEDGAAPARRLHARVSGRLGR